MLDSLEGTRFFSRITMHGVVDKEEDFASITPRRSTSIRGIDDRVKRRKKGVDDTDRSYATEAAMRQCGATTTLAEKDAGCDPAQASSRTVRERVLWALSWED